MNSYKTTVKKKEEDEEKKKKFYFLYLLSCTNTTANSLYLKKSYLEINMILKLKDTEYQQTDRRTDRCVVCSSEQRAAVVKQAELLTVLSYRF